jgi:chromosome segregation ATPase
MFEGIKKKISKIFGKKEYTIRLTPELWEQIPRLTQQQIAELLAENRELKQQIEKLKQEIKKEKPEDIKVLETALAKKKQLEGEKLRRRVVWVPFAETPEKTLVPLNVVYVPYGGGVIVGKSGKYKYLAGFEQEEDERGLTSSVNILLKTHPKAKRFARVSPKTNLSLADILNQPYFVKTLLSGVYNSPVNEKGEVVGEIYSVQSGLSNLNAQIEYLKQEIARLEEENERLRGENYSINKKYQDLLVENQKLRTELSLANYRADTTQALMLDQTQKVKDLLRDVATIHSSALESMVNLNLVERANWTLSEGLKKMREMIEQAYGKPIDEAVWERVRSEFRGVFSDVLTAATKLKEGAKTEIEKPKEEAKK